MYSNISPVDFCSQVDYGIKLVDYMIKNRIKCMDPTANAQEQFTSELQKDFKGMVTILIFDAS
jgi:hypothetical protein